MTRYLESDYLPIYVALVALGILNSGLFAAKINKVSYIFPVNEKFYKFYLKYYKVGLFQISSVLYAARVNFPLLVSAPRAADYPTPLG